MSRVCQCGGVIRENGKAFWDILPSCTCQFPVAIQYNYFTNLTTRIMKPMKDKELEEIRRLGSLIGTDSRNADKNFEQALSDLIAQERRKAKIEFAEQLKGTIKMHTVPEGRGLITRSYLNNSIDFMLAELKEDKE